MQVKDIIARLKRLPDFSIQKESKWFEFTRVVDRVEIETLINELEALPEARNLNDVKGGMKL